MPRKYLRQELEIRAGEKEIYVYNKHGDLIRTHKRSYTPKDWVIIPSDMPAEYKDYGYWTVALFPAESVRCRPQHPCIDRCSHPEIRLSGTVIPKLLWHPALRRKYSSEALERCCKDAVLAGKCNYSYICNTISTYHKESLQHPAPQSESNTDVSAAISGTYKDDDSKYSLRNLLKRQETEGGYEE